MSVPGTSFAVKLYSKDPSGIPDGYPSEEIPLNDGDPLPDGYTLMTAEQLQTQHDSVDAAYDTWKAAVVAKQVALDAYMKSRSFRKMYGAQILGEFEMYLAQRTLSPSDTLALITFLSPISGLIGFGFIAPAVLYLTNLGPNAVLDAVYAPTTLDLPAYIAGETLKVHFIKRLQEGLL